MSGSKKVGRENAATSNLEIKLWVFGIIISTFIAFAVVWYQDKLTRDNEHEQAERKVDTDLQRLINFQISNDQTHGIEAPSRETSRTRKLAFVRRVQELHHQETLAALRKQIPAVADSSDVNIWNAALDGHKEIERSTHRNFVAFWAQATWQEFVQSIVPTDLAQSQYAQTAKGVASLPAVVLDAAPQFQGTALSIPANVEIVEGVIVRAEPTRLLHDSYPFVDLSKASGAGTPVKGFFVPTFESLQSVGLFQADPLPSPTPEIKPLNIRN
jgi:hypothetical protein